MTALWKIKTLKIYSTINNISYSFLNIFCAIRQAVLNNLSYKYYILNPLHMSDTRDEKSEGNSRRLRFTFRQYWNQSVPKCRNNAAWYQSCQYPILVQEQNVKKGLKNVWFELSRFCCRNNFRRLIEEGPQLVNNRKCFQKTCIFSGFPISWRKYPI